MSEISNGVACQASEINALNFKMLADDTMSDLSINRKSLMRHQDAWETLRLRNSQFSASFDHMILAQMAISAQVGDTSAQQTTSPIRTGVGDTVASSAYPANRAVDTADAATSVAAAGVGTANEALAKAVADFANLVLQGVAALQAAVVTAGANPTKPAA